MKQSTIVLGAGGHAKVIIDSLCELHIPIACLAVDFFDDQNALFLDSPVLTEKRAIQTFPAQSHPVVNGVGILPGEQKRQTMIEYWQQQGYQFPQVIHPTAIVSQFACFKQGVQILARAVVQVASAIGEHCIINTAAVVEHDCDIAAHVHIAPGAILCGGVQVGHGAFIGAGAIVKPEIQIGANSVVAAGAVVVKDVAAGTTVVGIPARRQYE